MTHTYKITGMTCGGCETRVKSSLLMLPDVTEVTVSKEEQSAIISMEKHVSLSSMQHILGEKYKISPQEHSETAEVVKSWFVTYRPILLVFGYITTTSLIAGVEESGFNWMGAMNIFMAGFFLTFSFFKMLDLKSFAESYSMYDIVARRVKSWGYLYAFIELGLGISYATGFDPLITNIVTLIVMTISILGVITSLINKRKIRCACLGAVFNLPMSSITLMEDALMIAMSAGMIFVSI